MTRDQFRNLALGLPEAAESAHMAHPDFRVRGRIFATLGYPDERHAMVKLGPGQQADLMESDSSFSPAAGAWGRKGATTVLLKTAERELVRIALEAAWTGVAPKSLARPVEPSKSAAALRSTRRGGAATGRKTRKS
jgi:hypothetical protein